eukprot:TRINITY_DN16861_c0_g1_i2.p1 TRINITY_DN16861_c0_g1~~TRINITY_DN16861_c0_g1_i2.p1  ORF type:complete len:208 (-),score=42.10 TRINITY_DN16861_c0_g1_i2:55-588(-)
MSKRDISLRYREKFLQAKHQRQVRTYEAAWDECIRRERDAGQVAADARVRRPASPESAAEQPPAVRARKPPLPEDVEPPVVEFSLTYHTKFGQELCIVGSSAELGSWDLERRVPMSWTDGDVWVAKVEFPPGKQDVQYKYLLKKSDGGIVWESGLNHHTQVGMGVSPLKCPDRWGEG